MSERTTPHVDSAVIEDDYLAVTAREVADVAAAQAGVHLRGLTELDELAEAAGLFARIWGRKQGPPLTPELLRALSGAGSYIAGAFAGSTLVGASVGFHEEPAQATLHSHITGVVPGPWRHVGFAIKLHQRAWALQRGIGEIVWTFDPLVARNAYFNIAKLGAQPIEYLSNYYGNMADTINGTDETDRLLTRWSLHEPDVVAACAGLVTQENANERRSLGATVLLGTDVDGLPRVGEAHPDTVLLVAVPGDISGLRSEDPQAAHQWRIGVREALMPELAAGARIVGFDRAGWYILRRPHTMP